MHTQRTDCQKKLDLRTDEAITIRKINVSCLAADMTEFSSVDHFQGHTDTTG